MDLQLKGKVVVVTGGGKGIGAAIVRGCAAEGAIPVILDRDQAASEQLRGEIQGSGGTCGLSGPLHWTPSPAPITEPGAPMFT